MANIPYKKQPYLNDQRLLKDVLSKNPNLSSIFYYNHVAVNIIKPALLGCLVQLK